MRSPAAIRTPDNRLRVFVSSTLGELAAERQAVARAISTLRLTAVLFEAGARPHPPAELYQAYLEQSDVFLGMYWQRYGELVPGLDISGLEEEFDLSRGLPRLLYLKVPAPDRDPRLAELIDRLEQEASYRNFRTPAELGRLVVDDLAHLLSERFTSDGVAPVAAAPSGQTPLTLSTTSLVGRETAIEEVKSLLGHPEGRLVTLTGPSGVGKTRLAAAVAERTRERFDSDPVIVPLTDVTQPDDVVLRIGWALGADLAGRESPLITLAGMLRHGRRLLVLDNFERLLAAGTDVAELLARCPGLAILATSTAVLGLRAEHAYPVPPLPVPEAPHATTLAEMSQNPAVSLFVERAQAVRPDFSLTPDQGPAVVEICRQLEGLPLAIELAAARVQLLEPDDVLRRLQRSLDTLGPGMVDLPARQRTLRATVDWSIGMLGDAELSLLEVLAVFADGWTVEAAASVAALDEDLVLELTESLARQSLLHLERTPDGPRPRLLHTLRGFVADRLAARPDADQIRRRHAEYYRVLAEGGDERMRGFRQRECAENLLRESENVALAARWLLVHDPATLPGLLRVLTPFRILWPFLGRGDLLVGETRAWAAELLPTIDTLAPTAQAELLVASIVSALELGDPVAAREASTRLAVLLDDAHDPYLDAVSGLLMSWEAALAGELDLARRRVGAALDRLRVADEPMWTAVALLTSGSLESAVGDRDVALSRFREVHGRAGAFDNPWLDSVSHVALGALAIQRRDIDEAQAHLSRALDLSVSAGSTHGLCLALVGSAALALAREDAELAGLLVGAAEGLRLREALSVWPWTRGDNAFADGIRRAVGPEVFEGLVARGSRMDRAEVLDLARAGMRSDQPSR